MSESTAHMIYEATTKQIAGLELEREAHLQQIAGLVWERDALRVELGYKQAECAHLATLLAGKAAVDADDYAEPDMVRVPILGDVDSATGTITWSGATPTADVK